MTERCKHGYCDIPSDRLGAFASEISLRGMPSQRLQLHLLPMLEGRFEFLRGGGHLTVRTFDLAAGQRPGIGVEVADTGIGMTPEVMAKIFDPFFTSKKRQGTGLGLSITHTLIGRQGGTIAVESESGVGTKFSIWLPEAA